jgi:hypothetical protein
MQVPILNGITTDGAPDFRAAYPRNMVPVPKAQGISGGYLRPAEGLVQWSTATPGADRGGIEWNGAMYRVCGTSLVRFDATGAQTVLGTIPGADPVAMDYGFDRLAIAASGSLFYLTGSTLAQVTDPDLGQALDVVWVDGYYMTHDGTNIVVTELLDPGSVSPLRYGSSEGEPDRIVALRKLRREVHVINRLSIEVFQNVGGSGFPFQVLPGAQTQRGAVGPRAVCVFEEALAFVGSGRKESVGVYLASGGTTIPLSTREVERTLADYTEEQLQGVIVETRALEAHRFLYIHLPDQTLVYDAPASAAAGEPVWHVLTSGNAALTKYRARNFVFAFDRWIGGDPDAARLCELTRDVSSHYGAVVGWDFSTVVLYAEGNAGQVHEIELVALPGRVPLGVAPSVWTSYSEDGRVWSQERPISAGRQGDTLRRLRWAQQGPINHWRVQRFRGTSDAHLAAVRLEVDIEALNVKRRA